MNPVDSYISQFEPEVQSRLKSLRALFFELIPNCEESIRYNMPAYKVGKHHLYYAAYKNHIGFYPIHGIAEIEDQITVYRAKGTKDSLHFKHKDKLPIELVTEIIKLRLEKDG